MEEPRKTGKTGIMTGDIILKLRERAERVYKTNPKLADLLILAADRLDEQEERIAIMSEPDQAMESELTFPPEKDRTGGDDNQ